MKFTNIRSKNIITNVIKTNRPTKNGHIIKLE